ncbi:MAG: helix-turn-helix transcriptional regulator [Clostridia bacterium]|nr:helix-turn-helix transcriptional regulator [Clostridia bacterium]
MIRLFELRTEKELSQREMAKVFNVSQGTYNNWENGKTQPSIEQLIAISKYFQVSIDYLVDNDNQDYSFRQNSPDEDKFLSLYSNANTEIKNAVLSILEATQTK